MKDSARLLWLGTGLVLGFLGAMGYFFPSQHAQASNDRFEDYILCTGSCASTPRAVTDGLWMLDYRSGKLMATMIDRPAGKLLDFAELDLVGEFGIAPRQNVHFMMTTGHITQGQAALYVVETSTGKVGVYTMGPRGDGQAGVSIRRHDLKEFRKPANKAS